MDDELHAFAPAASSSANCASGPRVASAIAPRTVTAVGQSAKSFDAPSISFIFFAADGAQEPFSTNPTHRFWKFRAVKCSMNSRIFGKTPMLYVVVTSASAE